MYFYFSSAYSAVIKLNGIYYGVISNTLKSCNFQGELPLVEICPLTPDQNQINFFPDTKFLSAPPDGVAVTDLRGGYLINFLKNAKVGDFKVLCQKKTGEFLATAFIENGLKVSIETTKGFFADVLDFSADNAKIFSLSLNGQNFCLVEFTGEKKVVCAYCLSKNIHRAFLREVDDYSTDGGFFTTVKFLDVAKHKRKSEWEFISGEFKEKNFAVEKSPNFDFARLNDKIVPYAFLEEILCGGNPLDFLADNLSSGADRLKDYLGDFIGIMPPPVFRRQDEVGLIYPNGKNKYLVKYFTFSVENKKVTNFSSCE